VTVPAVMPASRDSVSSLRVGELTLVEVVARGPLATVYRATHPRRGEVAVKLYHREHELADTRARIESVAQAQVQHPSVARLIDAGRLADGRCYLASEWVDGPTLAALVPQRPAWARIRPIIASIASGLGAIHEAGIIHRDLKPSNVMLPPTGTPAATIVDFSHSLIVGDVRVTDAGLVLGSAAYMSPEQTRGDALDGRSDLYALGVILYELLCGEPPFAGEGADVLRRHQREPVVAPRKRAPDRAIPAAAEDVCMWLLAKDPAARVPNARVFAVTLAAMQAASPRSDV